MELALEVLLPPFVACLVLMGIHVYLGLHVVSRGVIFVDLALAQIAALGATFALPVGLPAEWNGRVSLFFDFYLHCCGRFFRLAAVRTSHPERSDHRYLLRRRLGRRDHDRGPGPTGFGIRRGDVDRRFALGPVVAHR